MALKDGTTSKNMLSRGLTSLLDSGKNKAIAAAGPAAAAAPAAAASGAAGAGAASLQNAPFATPKHHATEGRDDLQLLLLLLLPYCRWLLAADCCLLATIAAAAAGPAGCCSCCCWWCCWSCSHELHSEVLVGGCETAKHHGPEGRNDLQKHAVPRLDVPSGFW